MVVGVWGPEGLAGRSRAATMNRVRHRKDIRGTEGGQLCSEDQPAGQSHLVATVEIESTTKTLD